MHYITLTIRVYAFTKKGGNPPTQIFQKNNNSPLLTHRGKKKNTREFGLLKIRRQSLHLLSTSRVILTAKGTSRFYKGKR